MKYVVGLLLAGIVAGTIWWTLDNYQKTKKIENDIARQNINEMLTSKKLRYGLPVFIRIFKQSSELEVWMQKNKKFVHVKTYPICRWSGTLGPKLKQGDRQSPEGFYTVSKNQLNPNSKYHLAFNLGYPNKYDRAHNRTGDFLMVHGSCLSIGCYAITDAGITEVYNMASAALDNGQHRFNVHIFPFRLNNENLKQHATHKWYSFWQSLKPAYDWFEIKRTLPEIAVQNKKYTLLDQ